MKEINDTREEQYDPSKSGLRWKERLKFLAAISGFLALLSSAITFSISTGVSIYKEFTWKENLTVLKLESAEGYLFVNDGDGEIYVNDVSFYDSSTKRIKVDYLNKMVKPGQFLEFKTKRKDLNGYVPLMLKPDGWNQVFYALNKSYPGLSSEYSLPESDFIKILEQSAHENPDNLVKTKGKATVHYFGTKSAIAIEEEFDVVGVVWKSKALKSIPGKQGIDEKYNE